MDSLVAASTQALRIGVVGFSVGNGHPFSFSAIVNGYDDEAFGRAGWPVIHDYLRRREPTEFGFAGVRISHVWMPDPAMALALASACRIEHVVAHPDAMLGEVDAVMILRDDPESHWPLARSFLECGTVVFIDKPLTVDAVELSAFAPYLYDGKLMSCAGMRFAAELAPLRVAGAIAELGAIRQVECSVLSDWPRYGIHMLEAATNLLRARPVELQKLRGPAEHMAIMLDNGILVTINALGAVPKLFEITVRGERGFQRFHLHDNFSAFRAVLGAFIEQVRDGRPAIPPTDTLDVIATVQAGLSAVAGGAPVAIRIDEFAK